MLQMDRETHSDFSLKENDEYDLNESVGLHEYDLNQSDSLYGYDLNESGGLHVPDCSSMLQNCGCRCDCGYGYEHCLILNGLC